ncbi:beta-defensin 9 precursor [Rattus norvegicus]|uniref:Beta-defensin 9 n=2 Tax=Rattus norvegicus TaxID=10116 RepID=DEFB9_RAT|nr:beta-defensin 9 precursor [Rattus norvegicus]Q32ZI2.1 RecName: Full=Beta-defensin 9; Short=BD-9; AltName: Full=Defensin, beta 9; Flags: Precursor [Rattus norvegicus]AAT51880.1 beta-defensin 9 [Rattus norvegicus]|eukprot:NP_001032598.1 beta-defensin 9 precursor [Rattus norvegicus]
MRTLCSLLLICCLLFSYDTPVVGELKHLGLKTEFEQCQRIRGYCLNTYCRFPTSHVGSCYPEKRYCCKNIR